MEGVAGAHDLDDALLHNVLLNLDAADLIVATYTCHAWASAGSDDRLWQSAFRRMCSSSYLHNVSHQLDDMVLGENSSSALNTITEFYWRALGSRQAALHVFATDAGIHAWFAKRTHIHKIVYESHMHLFNTSERSREIFDMSLIASYLLSMRFL